MKSLRGAFRLGSSRLNVISQSVLLISQSALGFIFTPLFIVCLGVGTYALIAIANDLTRYVSIILLSLITGSTQFYTKRFHEKDIASANQYFSASVYVYACGGIVLVPAVALISWNASNLFKILPKDEQSAKALIALVLISYVINVVASPFEIPLIARNKSFILNAAATARLLLRFCMIYYVIRGLGFGVSYVGAIEFGLSVAKAVVIVAICFWLCGDVALVHPKEIPKSIFASFLKFSAFALVERFGFILLLSSDALIVNYNLGPRESGKYSAILQWVVLLKSIALTFSDLFLPSLHKYLAAKDRFFCMQAVNLMMKTILVCFGAIAAAFVVQSRVFLHLWLGNTFADESVLFTVLVLPIPIIAMFYPVVALLRATESMKLLSVILLVVGGVHIAASICLVRVFHFGSISVAVSNGLLSILFYLVVVNMQLKRKFEKSSSSLSTIAALLYQAAAIAISVLIYFLILPTDWLKLMVSISISVGLCIAAGAYFLFSNDEGRMLQKLLIGRRI